MFYAHSENDDNVRHLLKDHLLSSARLAASFAPSEETRHLFFLSGLFHDIGKFQDAFQNYLFAGGRKTPHAGIGAYLVSTLGKHLLPLQFVIKGHHSGLPDNEDRKQNNNEYSEEKEVVSVIKTRFSELFPAQVNEPVSFALPNDILVTECLTRFVFSGLTDADWLDTEHHFSPARSEARIAGELEHNRFIQSMEAEFRRLQGDGPINYLRTKARQEAVERISSPTGFFSLQLPTGLGKTLISTYWALLHARHHGLKRIIIVLPYLNIIDQTAGILKELFGEETVLEHHSGITEEDEDYRAEHIDRNLESARRLACENWDAPFIITTSVQFFESLFSNRPFKCRKNHNIADAVVVFDEIQTLPKHLAEPTVVMLKNIAELAHTSILFCTATQPAFAKRGGFDGIESIHPLIDKPEEYFKATRRVSYKLLNGLEEICLDDLMHELSKEKGSFLAIVNTKKVARELFEGVNELKQFTQKYHLSTAMCPHHRKGIIKQIKTEIETGHRIAVISTQLVEAGVDLDFPCVYRAVAPMDAVIQSAGRCNRNGTLRKKGRVVLFNLEHQSWPDATYKSSATWTIGKIKDKPGCLHRVETFEEYYEEVTTLFLDPDRFKITDDRRAFNFQSVADKYRIIDNPTVALVIARYSLQSESLLDELKESMERPGNTNRTRQLLRLIQQYSVQVYRPFLEKYNIKPYHNSLYIWYGNYDADTGLSPENIETVF